MIAFTIVNANYLHFAFTLAQSYLEKNAESEFYLFLLGADREVIGVHQRLKIVNLNDSIIAELNQRAFYYEITELSTSVKPNCFWYLFNLGYDKVIYLDPDIYVLNPLDYLSDLLNKNSIVITPHSTSPIYDQDLPDDLNFLKAGSYNLGFIAVANNNTGRRFIEWWSDRLSVNAFNSFSKGMFTDQKWIDLVPSYFDEVFILKNPGYNVAYWNLHERSVDKICGKYFCNDEKLYFFHFSGISLKDTQVSKYTTRYQDHFDLGLGATALFEEYRQKLSINFEATVEERSLPYAYNNFSDGRSITNIDRLLYFNSFINGVSLDNPFILSRSEFLKFIGIERANRKTAKFTTDPRIEKLAGRAEKLPYPIKKLLQPLISSGVSNELLGIANNSVNKVNVARMIYSLYRRR